MITTQDEAWATETLRDAQDPGAGKQSWTPLTRITLERHNLIFSQVHSRGYETDGQTRHDAATCLENSKAILVKVALVGGDLKFTKWSVANGLQYDDVVIVANVNLSNTARPSVELTAGTQATIRVFYVDEDDDYIHYKESTDGGANFGAEANVGVQANLKAIASTSPTKVHCVSYADGNSRFHYFKFNGSWAETNSLIYWPHKIEHIDAITIGDRDLVVFYSQGPMYGSYREAGIYGIWVEHGRWSDIFKIDVLDEADAYAYRTHPMISEANGIYFLTGYLSEGDADYSHTTRFLKTSKDGQGWSQCMPLVTCPEAGPAKLLVINAAAGESWPWDTGQQVYVVGYDKVYESDATRLVGEINTSLQVDVSSRTRNWQLQRGVVSQANTILANHDGGLDSHAIINADNTLLLKREAGYHTGEGDEFAQITLEIVDFIKETDQLPQRHKQVASRDFMAWVRDREADHFECWESQLVGYDNYADDTETGYGGLGHTATQRGWWETKSNVLWLKSNNEMGLAFATWDSKIMNGQVKAMIRVETAGNDEYAGVVFRALDSGNFWAAYYDEDSDKIVLRRRIGGAWGGVVASSSTLSWSIDTWYGIMVDFRYNYFRVFYSVDGKSWTQAFTYIAPATALSPAFEYGYVGAVGYGYSSDDEEESPGYTPPTPPPPTAPPSEPGVDEGNLLYFVDGTNGRVFRTRNARADAADVIYEDLGQVNSQGGLYWIALDEYDPLNKAMVCGEWTGGGGGGIWRTTNLNDDTPTWTAVGPTTLGELAADDYLRMVASSPQQESKWWAILWFPGHSALNNALVGLTEDDGLSWVWWAINPIADFPNLERECPKIEVSTLVYLRAWIMYYQQNTNTCWRQRTITQAFDTGSKEQQAIAGLASAIEIGAHCYHPYMQPVDCQIALFGGRDEATNTARVVYSTDDGATGTVVTLNTGGGANARVEWVGGYLWRVDRWWALTYDGTNGYRFHVSDNAINWTLQHTFAGVSRYILPWRFNENWFYATQDGAVAPLLISNDRGGSWQAQAGNWSTLGYAGNIQCVAAVWV